MAPMFKHDCKHCNFIGHIFVRLFSDRDTMQTADLYLSCDNCSKYIIRKSDEGSDYITTNDLAYYTT
jgi:hypothetical protein